jgi:hypothetical protein
MIINYNDSPKQDYMKSKLDLSFFPYIEQEENKNKKILLKE